MKKYQDRMVLLYGTVQRYLTNQFEDVSVTFHFWAVTFCTRISSETRLWEVLFDKILFFIHPHSLCYQGDCWLLAAISSICQYPILLHQVVPGDQDPSTVDYVGIFRARFWHFGHWVEVLVDDRLPVYRGTKQLIFMKSKHPDEFWSALSQSACQLTTEPFCAR